MENVDMYFKQAMSRKKLMTFMKKDVYKESHVAQLSDSVEELLETWTPRGTRIDGIDSIILFNLQAFVMEYLIEDFNDTFFNVPLDDIIAEYKMFMGGVLFNENPDLGPITSLHNLGYLPIEIRAVKEGTRVPMRCPAFTFRSTKKGFAWVAASLETLTSAENWSPITVATIAAELNRVAREYCLLTTGSYDGSQFSMHDFSMRGMSGVAHSAAAGAGVLLSGKGTDSFPAIHRLWKYYAGEVDMGGIGASVPACYDDATEILSENGWKLFKDLLDGEMVAQYHADGSIDFVSPLKYYNMAYNGKIIKFKSSTDNGFFDIAVTPNHRMFRLSNKTGELQEFEADDKRYRFKNGYGTKNKLIVSGVVESGDGMSWMEKLMVAFQADGSYLNRKDSYTGERSGTIPIRFSLKKDRKVKRLIYICDNLNVEYSVSDIDSRGYVSFYIKLDKEISKTFDWIDISSVSKEWCDDFFEELSLWDGCKQNNCVKYSSAIEYNVDVVQALSCISERKCKKGSYVDKRDNRKDQFTACISNVTAVGGDKCKKYNIEYRGTVHCVSVPTKKIIVRRNGVVCMSGNTEHMVMCAGMDKNRSEEDLLRKLLTETYPTGIFSAVLDAEDFWHNITVVLPRLRKEIMARDGKFVCRPDSGSPADVICGTVVSCGKTPQEKGLIQVLYEEWGGTISDTGFKLLDSHIGAIYGDSITMEVQLDIYKRLVVKGFSTMNVVLGIGSYQYNMNTRDTFNQAFKAVNSVVNGVDVPLFKDPKDSPMKKSQRGRVVVYNNEDGKVCYIDGLTSEQALEMEDINLLEVVYKDGKLMRFQTHQEIYDIVMSEI